MKEEKHKQPVIRTRFSFIIDNFWRTTPLSSVEEATHTRTRSAVRARSKLEGRDALER